jgi:hypothetical protein
MKYVIHETYSIIFNFLNFYENYLNVIIINIKYYKNPSCMTKYFDKLLKIKLYISYYLLHGNMKNNAILEHVDFF